MKQVKIMDVLQTMENRDQGDIEGGLGHKAYVVGVGSVREKGTVRNSDRFSLKVFKRHVKNLDIEHGLAAEQLDSEAKIDSIAQALVDVSNQIIKQSYVKKKTYTTTDVHAIRTLESLENTSTSPPSPTSPSTRSTNNSNNPSNHQATLKNHL